MIPKGGTGNSNGIGNNFATPSAIFTKGYNLNSSIIHCIFPSHSSSGISKDIPSQVCDKGNAPNNSSMGLIYSHP